MRAWHERYERGGPARDRRPRLRLRTRRAIPTRCAAAVARLEIPYPVVVDAELEIWQRVRQPRLAGPLPVQPARDAVRVPLRRGRLRRDRAGDPGAARRRASRRSRRCGPRTRPARGWRPRATTSTGPTAGPTRPAGCGRCSTARARSTANGRELAVDHPGAYELIAHPAQHRRRARSSRSAPACAATRSASRPGSGVIRSSRLTQLAAGPRRRASTRSPRGRGCVGRIGPRKPGSCDPAAAVDQLARRRACATRPGRRRAAGRRDGCGRRST